jgi:hypothetical protein
MERPKAGFSIPINIWLKKDLSYLIDDHLSASSMSQSRFFNEKYILIKLSANKKQKDKK